jgi:alkylation response protein AidB-like acyl-CoA dehydrogenase
MDFSLSDEQQEIAALAAQILSDKATHERMRALETSAEPRFDRELWRDLAQAGLVGIAIPESYGGGGLGFLELSLIVEEVGRRAAPVPLLECAVMGALPIAAFGSERQKQEILPRVAAGECILTAALVEAERDPHDPAVTAKRGSDGWTLRGTKTFVPAGQLADLILVPAHAGAGGVAVFLIERGAAGVRIDELSTTSGQPESSLVLDGVAVPDDRVLGDPAHGRTIVDWIVERTTAAQCALATGVCAEALRLTAEFTKTREQFGVAIATFQAVAHRAADAYIDSEAVRLTARQACWRIASELPAAEEVAIAKFWAAWGGQRVVHAAQHLHGGIGVDRDYPLHRYFLYAKQLELTLGGATQQLLRLGKMIAA